MKIRTGFVSNSSSSSFCMYGASFSFDEMKEILEEIGKDPGDKNPYENNIGAWLEYEKNDVFPTLEVRHCGESEEIYVGRSWTLIGGEETGNQFKAAVENKLKGCLGKEIECDNMEETIYN